MNCLKKGINFLKFLKEIRQTGLAYERGKIDYEKYLQKRNGIVYKRILSLTEKIEVKEGKLHSDTELILMNHTSFFDPFLFPFITQNKRLIAMPKKELLNIPFYKYLVKYDIIIDRNNKMQALSLIRQIKKKKRYGILMVFPEGTRNNGITKFKPGLAKVIERAGIKKIQYVKIEGLTRKTGLCDKKDICIYYSQQIDISKNKNWYSEEYLK